MIKPTLSTIFKKAAVVFSTGHDVEVQGSKLVISKIDYPQAEQAVLSMLKDGVLEDGAVTGFKRGYDDTYKTVTRGERYWDPNATDMCDGRGDWVDNTWEETVKDGTVPRIHFHGGGGKRELDVCFDASGKKLVLLAAAVDEAVLTHALSDPETCKNALFALAERKYHEPLGRALEDLAELAAPSVGEAMDPGALGKYRQKVQKIAGKIADEMEKAGITGFLTPAKINAAVEAITGKPVRVMGNPDRHLVSKPLPRKRTI